MEFSDSLFVKLSVKVYEFKLFISSFFLSHSNHTFIIILETISGSNQLATLFLFHSSVWKCIDSCRSHVLLQESIIWHRFKWQKSGVVKLLDPLLYRTVSLERYFKIHALQNSTCRLNLDGSSSVFYLSNIFTQVALSERFNVSLFT